MEELTVPPNIWIGNISLLVSQNSLAFLFSFAVKKTLAMRDQVIGPRSYSL